MFFPGLLYIYELRFGDAFYGEVKIFIKIAEAYTPLNSVFSQRLGGDFPQTERGF